MGNGHARYAHCTHPLHPSLSLSSPSPRPLSPADLHSNIPIFIRSIPHRRGRIPITEFFIGQGERGDGRQLRRLRVSQTRRGVSFNGVGCHKRRSSIACSQQSDRHFTETECIADEGVAAMNNTEFIYECQGRKSPSYDKHGGNTERARSDRNAIPSFPIPKGLGRGPQAMFPLFTMIVGADDDLRRVSALDPVDQTQEGAVIGLVADVGGEAALGALSDLPSPGTADAVPHAGDDEETVKVLDGIVRCEGATAVSVLNTF
jgi:hypothetical protein